MLNVMQVAMVRF